MYRRGNLEVTKPCFGQYFCRNTQFYFVFSLNFREMTTYHNSILKKDNFSNITLCLMFMGLNSRLIWIYRTLKTQPCWIYLTCLIWFRSFSLDQKCGFFRNCKKSMGFPKSQHFLLELFCRSKKCECGKCRISWNLSWKVKVKSNFLSTW